MIGYDVEQMENKVTDYKEIFDSKTTGRDVNVQGDYTHSFNERWKWETGLKVTEKKLHSKSEIEIYDFAKNVYLADPVRSNDFSYESMVYALYQNLSLKLTKWSLTAGLRYERTTLNASFQDTFLYVPSYNNVVPQILLSRIYSDKTSLKLGYSMKLLRPYISYLNPTINKSDSLTTQFGNPYLRPEITNRYQLCYTVNDPKIFRDLMVFFNDNVNSIENIRTPVQVDIFESTWKNIGQNRRLGLSVTLTWKPLPALSLGTMYTGQYIWLRSRSLNISNSGLMHQLVLNGSCKLKKGYSVDFYGFFDSKNLRLQGYRSGWKFYSLTFSKKSADERFNVSFRAETFLTPFTFIKDEITTESFHQLQSFRYQNQHLRLSFSFKLGKKEIKSPHIRQVENGD